MIERTCRTKSEAQALAQFLWNEWLRHLADMNNIFRDLELLRKKYNIKPRKNIPIEFVKP